MRMILVLRLHSLDYELFRKVVPKIFKTLSFYFDSGTRPLTMGIINGTLRSVNHIITLSN